MPSCCRGKIEILVADERPFVNDGNRPGAGTDNGQPSQSKTAARMLNRHFGDSAGNEAGTEERN